MINNETLNESVNYKINLKPPKQHINKSQDFTTNLLLNSSKVHITYVHSSLSHEFCILHINTKELQCDIRIILRILFQKTTCLLSIFRNLNYAISL